MTQPQAIGGSSSTGLAPNLAGALSYVLGPITGILFYLIEKENRFVRFHAMQSILVGVTVFVVSILLSIVSGILAVVPVLGWIAALLVSIVLGIGSFVLWLLLIWRAYHGESWEVPVVGGYARRIADGGGIA